MVLLKKKTNLLKISHLHMSSKKLMAPVIHFTAQVIRPLCQLYCIWSEPCENILCDQKKHTM